MKSSRPGLLSDRSMPEFFFWRKLQQSWSDFLNFLLKEINIYKIDQITERCKRGGDRNRQKQKQSRPMLHWKKLPHSNSLALSGREEHQLDKRDKSSLHLRDIIKFVSSSLLKTFAFLHFRIFQRTQVMTVLLILGHRSMRGFTIHNCSTPRAWNHHIENGSKQYGFIPSPQRHEQIVSK